MTLRREPGPKPRPAGEPADNRTSTNDVLVALRAIRNGGLDDSARALELGPAVAGSLTAVLAATRWGAVMIGLAWAAQRLAGSGELSIVATLTAAIFLASWRTVRPLRLGDGASGQQAFALSDVAILSAAIGIDSGLASPFVGTVLVSVAVVGFGWGLRLGLWAALTALVVTTTVPLVTPADFVTPSPLGVMALAAAAVFPGIAQFRLLHLEDRRQVLSDSVTGLSETNQLLGALNQVARTLPSSLDLEDILKATRSQLMNTFDAQRLAVLLSLIHI